MDRWDHLRAFHARHPNLGALEPVYLQHFEAEFKRLKRAKSGRLPLELFYCDACRSAAKVAEQKTLERCQRR